MNWKICKYQERAKDFVTKTDKRAKKLLLKNCKIKKSYSFISEESGKIIGAKNVFWIRSNYEQRLLQGILHFAISIALKQEDEIIIGLIFDPIKNEIFYAEKDNGSFLTIESEFQANQI